MPLEKDDFPVAYVKWQEVTSTPCRSCHTQVDAATYKCYNCFIWRKKGCKWCKEMMEFEVRGEEIGSRAPIWWRQALNSPGEWGVIEEDEEDKEEMEDDDGDGDEDMTRKGKKKPRKTKKTRTAERKKKGRASSKNSGRQGISRKKSPKKGRDVKVEKGTKKRMTHGRTAKSSTMGSRTTARVKPSDATKATSSTGGAADKLSSISAAESEDSDGVDQLVSDAESMEATAEGAATNTLPTTLSSLLAPPIAFLSASTPSSPSTGESVPVVSATAAAAVASSAAPPVTPSSIHAPPPVGLESSTALEIDPADAVAVMVPTASFVSYPKSTPPPTSLRLRLCPSTRARSATAVPNAAGTASGHHSRELSMAAQESEGTQCGGSRAGTNDATAIARSGAGGSADIRPHTRPMTASAAHSNTTVANDMSKGKGY
ncbi:hypothetical protein C8Q79DRAFT_928120 [Trametes meyenii]|nr:hypothetical protein C8Q79DRAFT_928120 [Trametes meyenii]